MVVQHNMSAINSKRQLGIVNSEKEKSAEKLGSGYKINRAADDTAGLAISEKMRRSIRGLSQGSHNVQDGISMLQVGDGALDEVTSMIHRMSELSIKSANETLTDSDRKYIQSEIDALCKEISKIEETTTFNEKKLFGNGAEIIRNGDGSPLIEGDIDFDSFSFADVTINPNPVFTERDGGNTHAFQAIVNDTNSAANGNRYGLIFGNGSTSAPSIRFTYNTGTTVATRTAALAGLVRSEYTNNTDIDGTVSRKMTYDTDGIKFSITEKVTPHPNAADDFKYYTIDYDVENECDAEINFEMLFHVDTAYNNNDTCESYYIGGERIDTTRIYKTDSYTGVTDRNGVITTNDVPLSLSVVNKDEALAFSEKVVFNDRPDALSVDVYAINNNWNYYSQTALGNITNSRDLGFGAIWQRNGIARGNSFHISLNYGIAPTANDPNLNQNEVHTSNNPASVITEARDFWIQASGNSEDGMYITFGKIDLDTLDIRNLSVSDSDNARKSIDRLKHALEHVSSLRSRIGAQQNMLEHTKKNRDNAHENTQSAESLIRDTDFATEMVRFSNKKILQNVGESMLAQANQSKKGVVDLLQE